MVSPVIGFEISPPTTDSKVLQWSPLGAVTVHDVRPVALQCTLVVLLLVLLAATVITGLIVYGGDQQAGPLGGIVSKSTGERLEEAHELIANVTLAFVLAHVAAVALASFAHRENLIRSMLTGYKRP